MCSVLFLLIVSALILGCAKDKSSVAFEKTLRPPTPMEQSSLPQKEEPAMADQTTTQRFSQNPPIPQPPAAVQVQETPPKTGFQGKISLTMESVSLPAFINEVYGNILNRSFEIAPTLQESKDLVTVRSAQKLAPQEVETLARQVLSNYGVAVQKQGSVYRFDLAKQGIIAGEPPLLISGRTLPDVPLSHRPIFQLVPLKVVSAQHADKWLKQTYQGFDIKFFLEPTVNAVLMRGSRPLVAQALNALKVLDRPAMRGRYSMRIEPLYTPVEDLTKMLEEVMGAEGYAVGRSVKAGSSSVILLPLETVNAIMVFAADHKTLTHVRDWTETLDRPDRNIREQEGLFYYQVNNTRAEDIYDVLQNIVENLTPGSSFTTMNVANSPSTQPQTQKTAASAAPKAQPKNNDTRTAQPQSRIEAIKQRDQQAQQEAARAAQDDEDDNQSRHLVVDKVRNALIFQGRRGDWEQLLQVIREMDKAPRMVLIEVTVAEITLTDEEQLGVEWLLENSNLGDDFTQRGSDSNPLSGTIKTLGNLGTLSQTQGLNFVLDNAGQTRAILNAFASKNRVSILSTPRVMVKSGGSATIDVGTEIPTLRSQFQGTTTDDRVLQEIQYRKTGVSLNVTPVVHSGHRIELEVSQEISQSQPNSNSNIDSPDIFTRRIETSLGLRDGGSVLLGGLIARDRSHGYSGVPILSDIPVVGRMFRVESESNTKNELVMLIVPYVIDTDQEATDITNALLQRLDGIGVDKRTDSNNYNQ